MVYIYIYVIFSKRWEDLPNLPFIISPELASQTTTRISLWGRCSKPLMGLTVSLKLLASISISFVLFPSTSLSFPFYNGSCSFSMLSVILPKTYGGLSHLFLGTLSFPATIALTSRACTSLFIWMPLHLNVKFFESNDCVLFIL